MDKKQQCPANAFYAMRSSLLHMEMAEKWHTPFWWTSSWARYQWNMDVSREYQNIAQQLFDGPCDDRLLDKKAWLDEHTVRCAQHSLCYGKFEEEKKTSL